MTTKEDGTSNWFEQIMQDTVYSVLDNYTTFPSPSHSGFPGPPSPNDRFAFDELVTLSNSDSSVDLEGIQLSSGLQIIDGNTGSPQFWSILKEEIRKLICTENREYADLRRHLDLLGKVRRHARNSCHCNVLRTNLSPAERPIDSSDCPNSLGNSQDRSRGLLPNGKTNLGCARHSRNWKATEEEKELAGKENEPA